MADEDGRLIPQYPPIVERATIAKRAEKLLSGPNVDREDIRFFLAQLLQQHQSQVREVTKAISRSFILAFVFVVLSNSTIAEAELMGVKVQDFSFFRLAIPVVMTVMVLRAIVALRASSVNYQVFYHVVKRHLPNWHDSGLVDLLVSFEGHYRPGSVIRISTERNIQQSIA
ncbi:hypothetical protein [Micromonospora sp. NPDC048898]|uniref:hypothetical protein n=1 Tax=Micromonospora sp. NPDC048898 TaxID=3364260 RepID=UPI00371DBEFA